VPALEVVIELVTVLVAVEMTGTEVLPLIFVTYAVFPLGEIPIPQGSLPNDGMVATTVFVSAASAT